MVDKKNAKNAKNAKKYYCEKCDFLTCKKSNWNKHITTAKHKMLTNVDDGNKTIYKCVCGKKYAYRQSLHRHKMVKKCEKMFLLLMMCDFFFYYFLFFLLIISLFPT